MIGVCLVSAERPSAKTPAWTCKPQPDKSAKELVGRDWFAGLVLLGDGRNEFQYKRFEYGRGCGNAVSG